MAPTPFLKMHGLGNDFVVIDARSRPLALDDAQARAIADRRRGIGCDQLIVLEKAENGADVRMRIRNADGGEVEACGNASRCVAALVMEERRTDRVIIDTAGGRIEAHSGVGGAISVDMGEARLGWREIP